MGVLLYTCCIFSEHLFRRTPMEGRFCWIFQRILNTFMITLTIIDSLKVSITKFVSLSIEYHFWLANHCMKSVHNRSFSGPYFPSFRLTTERHRACLCILSNCRKKRTSKIPNMDTFHAVNAIRVLLAVSKKNLCVFFIHGISQLNNDVS